LRNITNNLIALDIETAQPDGTAGDLALDHNRNIITKIAVYTPNNGQVFNGLADGKFEWCLPDQSALVCHNGKFDFKTLIAKGAPLTPDDLVHDTMVMAVVFPHKIPESWLTDYEAKRKLANAALGANVHRNAGGYSLKTLAPYFLGVKPFWEVANHANDEYALKDARYTYELAQYFLSEMNNEQYAFYQRIQEWNRMLLKAELYGAAVDFKAMEKHEIKAAEMAKVTEAQLKEEWMEHFEAYKGTEEYEIKKNYAGKFAAAVQKLKDPTVEKIDKTLKRYDALEQKALTKIEPFNLGSPTQLKWLFKERMGVDITTFSGDEESTGKAVLERLAGEGVKGVETFLKWRKANKLITAFFPTYRSEAFRGRIHTSYNLSGTRTGRLSSSGPNLQQIPKDILDVFKAPDGSRLVYRDVSAIEPRLIAYETEDPALCKIFLDGSDFHSFNVRVMLGIEEEDAVIKKNYSKERDLAKEIGLALMYGAGSKRIQESAAKRGFKWSEKKCREINRNFQRTYERVWEFKSALERSIKAGETVTNVLGRPLAYDMERLHMQSLNTKIQSGGSDLLLESVYRATQQAQALNISFQPILFIHDSITVECLAEDALRCYDLIGESIASWELDTVWGRIPLLSEGGIYQSMPAKS
jgi:DNA polymerase I-like protein with 3'-5' exonuclease and polymerase domains